MVGVALVYFVMSALVKWQGIRVIEKLFPPVVIGPVIILIGLSLAGTGVNMAKRKLGAGLVVVGYCGYCFNESERTF